MREHTATDFRVGAVDEAGGGTYLSSESPNGRFQVVFEDDGVTAYFYALDTSRDDQPIMDALHVYNVEQVVDRDLPSRASIGWSTHGLAAALFINGYAHAAFDFAHQRGWCRSGFPPPAPSGPWRQESHVWDTAADSVVSQ